jgi:hypothetical protein
MLVYVCMCICMCMCICVYMCVAACSSVQCAHGLMFICMRICIDTHKRPQLPAQPNMRFAIARKCALMRADVCAQALARACSLFIAPGFLFLVSLILVLCSLFFVRSCLYFFPYCLFCVPGYARWGLNTCRCIRRCAHTWDWSCTRRCLCACTGTAACTRQMHRQMQIQIHRAANTSRPEL